MSVRRCLEQEVKILSQVGGVSDHLQIFHASTANNQMLERPIEKAFAFLNLNFWESETFFHLVGFGMLLTQ